MNSPIAFVTRRQSDGRFLLTLRRNGKWAVEFTAGTAQIMNEWVTRAGLSKEARWIIV